MNDNLDHYFFNVHHAGIIDEALPNRMEIRAGTAQSKTEIILTILVFDGYIQKAQFKAYGSPLVIAGLEWMCETLEKHSFPIDAQMSLEHLSRQWGVSKSHSDLVLLQSLYQKLKLKMSDCH